MNVSDARKAHKILDDLFKGNIVLDEEREFLRSALPELPKQKTLEEITERVREAWVRSSGNIWTVDISDPDVTVEGWLRELYAQLKGVEEEAAPALPVGMRVAEHENFGRVVVSPGVGIDRCHEIFYLDPGMSSGTDISEVEPDSLTFIDAEPAKPVHPEFLETEADYANAPVGTVAIHEDGYPWTRIFGSWVAYSRNEYSPSEMATLRGKSRVLRWGGAND